MTITLSSPHTPRPPQSVLTSATEKSDNPDLRDRGYIYWRLLSADPDAAKAVILAERPVIADDTSSIESSLLDNLTRNLATLASVYHKPAEAFVRRARATYEDDEEDEDEIDVYGDEEVTGGSLPAPAAAQGGDDLLGMGSFGGASAAASTAAAAAGGGLDDFFGSSAAPAAVVPSLPVCGEKDGIEMRAGLSNKNGVPTLELCVVHKTGAAPVGACMLKINVNSLGAAVASPAVNFPFVAAGASGSVSLPLCFSPAQQSPSSASPDVIQAALRDNASSRVVFFAIPVASNFSSGFTTFAASSPADRNAFVGSWRSLTAEQEAAEVARDVPTTDASAVQAKLARANVYFIAARPGPDPSINLSYFSAKGASGDDFFVEITFKAGVPAVKVVVKTSSGSATAKVALSSILATLRA